MVFKDLEGTKQARKELAEKESKILLSLQGSKPSKPQPNPKPKPEQSSSSLLEMINVGFEDYKQFEAMFKDEYTNSDYDSEVEMLSDPKVLPKLDNPGEMNYLKEYLQGEVDSPSAYSPYMLVNTTSGPAHVAFEKMCNIYNRKLLKTFIIKYHGNEPDLSIVDSLTDEQVDEMILTYHKLEQVQGKSTGMPESEPFGHYGY